MNKHQRLVNKMFKIWFPNAVKNSNVREEDIKKEYRKFRWSYSDATLEEVKEDLEDYRIIDKIQNKDDYK